LLCINLYDVAFASVRGTDFDVSQHASNSFELEWPRGSGTIRQFPEIDHVAWVPLQQARELIHKSQASVLDAVEVFVSALRR
jgi:predicted NUDIX family NTP pyrophosphohydrolase